jgi:Flp pilus assembly protein TadD
MYQAQDLLDLSISHYRIALELDPTLLPAHYNLGYALQRKGQLDEAISHYRIALELDPTLLPAHYNLGYVLQQKGQLDEAISHYRKALELNPNIPDVYSNLALALYDKKNFDEAAIYYQKALELNPNIYDAYNNLGAIAQESGNFADAITCFQHAVRLNPNSAEAYSNLGNALYNIRRIDAALECYEKALSLDPDFAEAHWNLSHLLLLQGNFKEGWKEYEWRPSREDMVSRSFPQLMWDGSPLKGKRLLVCAEQGVGDEIMFASCLPEIIDQAERCIIESDARLVPLFRRSFPRAQVIERQDREKYPPDLPRADCHIPMGSLPRFLRPDIESFPRQPSYLIPDNSRVSEWRKRYGGIGNGLKVGISWRGGSRPDVIRARSIGLEQWTELFSISGINFIKLQYGDCSEELRMAKESLGGIIYDWEDANPLVDLDGFAAQIAALDLVISVDNATVHMAGASGTPVWVLLPFNCDWRWMNEREDTPWYRTVRLYRQDTFGFWHNVLKRVSSDLKHQVNSSSQ